MVLHNALWFLTSALFCVIVAIVCRKVAGGHPAVYISAIVLSLALPDSFELVFDKYMLPYFVAGILFRRYASKIAPGTYRAAWVISLVTFCVLLVQWKTEYYIYSTGMSLYVSDPRHRLFIIGFRYLVGFAGIGSIVPAVHLLLRFVTPAPFVSLGKCTMGVYLLSMFLNPYLYHLGIPHSNVLLFSWITTPAFSGLLCVLCVYGTKAIQLRKPIALLLLGG